jgi:hypothetical protein
MMTATEVRETIREYNMSGDVVGHFSGTTGATISKWTQGLAGISEETQERISTAVSAMASISHYYNDLPIRWSEVEKLQPLVERFVAEHCAYLLEKTHGHDQ